MIGKTIQIYLPDGNPRSVKIAEFTNRTIKSILIPREKLDFAFERHEIKSNAVYFLLEESTEGALPLLYIGETEDCIKRLKDHNKKKDFWTTVIVVTSSNGQFTKAHIKYLEWYCCEIAKTVNRFNLENSNNPTKPQIPEPLEADLHDIYETIKTLVSTLGYPIFDVIGKTNKKSVFFCKGKNALAEGEYNEDGFIVYAGSKTNIEIQKGAGAWVNDLQRKLVSDNILTLKENIYQFTSNYAFKSPSAASSVVLARSSNGWTEWKNKEGKTLDSIYRK